MDSECSNLNAGGVTGAATQTPYLGEEGTKTAAGLHCGTPALPLALWLPEVWSLAAPLSE